MKKFSETERAIKGLFIKTKKFEYEGTQYSVLKCGKPTPSKGECKTDVYVLAQDSTGKQKSLKYRKTK